MTTVATTRLGLLLHLLAPEAVASQTVDLTRYRVVDLTHAFGSSTLFWPTATTGFTQQQLSYGPTPGGWFYSAYAYAAPEHGGTHLDAPVHFNRDGTTSDRIPVEQFIGPAVVIDVTSIQPHSPSFIRWPRCRPPDSVMKVVRLFLNALRYRWNHSSPTWSVDGFVHVSRSLPASVFFMVSSCTSMVVCGMPAISSGESRPSSFLSAA